MGYWSDLRAYVLKDPAKLIRYVVLFVCCIVVIVQLYDCFTKLRDPPLSTHAYYNLNETIEMPAVSICREPPYKAEVLTNISGNICSHPKYATCWKQYPYDSVDLNEFFWNGTFNISETFFGEQYGLNGLADNVYITSDLNFNRGRCHTIHPKIPLKRAGKSAGYSMMLTHHVSANATSNLEHKPGWHIFIHSANENYTEIRMKGSGRVEYIFVEINEEIEIKLHAKHFKSVPSTEEMCSMDENYSELKCGEQCTWEDLVAKANCSGPWMHGATAEPCADYDSMKSLTNEYSRMLESDDDDKCNCIEPCETRIYSTFVQNRKEFIQPVSSTQLWIYYSTNLISMIEERPSYDTTQFIADIGGSLGFLLGLSVLGFIGILEHLTLFCFGGAIKKMQQNYEERKKVQSDEVSQSSAETVDIATIAQAQEKELV